MSRIYCETLVTEEEDKQKEREHIKEALARCGYSQWTISTVQRKLKTKKEDNMKKTDFDPEVLGRRNPLFSGALHGILLVKTPLSLHKWPSCAAPQTSCNQLAVFSPETQNKLVLIQIVI